MPKAVDIAGERFGRWLAINYAGKSTWNCICTCGTKKFVKTANLRSGASTSCGCYHKEVLKGQLRDLTGQRFGRLIVLSHSRRDNHSHNFWNCTCDCGKQTTVDSWALFSEITKSCGCLAKQVHRLRLTTHGKSKTKEWRLWQSAKARAKAKGVPFEILVQDLPEIPDICPIMGFPLVLNNDNLRFDSPTLDRIIPSLGYVKGNIQIISWRANSLKSDATYLEIETLYLFWKNQISKSDKSVEDFLLA